MYRPLRHSQRGFMRGFRQCGVGMDDAGEVFCACAKFHRHHRLCDHLGGVGAENMHAENAVGIAMCDDFDQALRLAQAVRAPVSAERKLADIIIYATLA